MIFHPLKRMAWVVGLLVAGLSGIGFGQAAIDTNGIPFGAELSGNNSVPTNALGYRACGRLWLVGTNLYYRFAVNARDVTAAEFRGPSWPESNGPVVQTFQHPFRAFRLGDLCDAAAGNFDTNTVPLPSAIQVRISEGVLPLLPEHIDYLFAGLMSARFVLFERVKPPGVADVKDQIRLLDTDGDGIPDYLDQCPGTLAGSLVNSNGCSIADLCPCEGPWKNHGQFEHCVKEAAKDFEKAGLITKPQRHEIEKAAKESDCGKKEKPPKPPKGD